ncbi:MAG: hypothetical protein M9930_06365 [Anaerolineae bacterium]|nr:hypothetical protein [Anaerolineae bacterium]
MIPYILMASLYIVLAVLMALGASLTQLQILPWFSGVAWLRVHLITLGALTQMLFGGLPYLTAIRNRLPRPATRWDIWLTLNAGILTLLVGIPLMNALPIIVGGTLVFTATILLLIQISRMRTAIAKGGVGHKKAYAGSKFYIAGLVYFLLGIVIGTGLWTGWSTPLGILGNVKEVHIHANSWGLMSLVFAGLLVDMYPEWTKKALAYPKTVTPIFWMMVLGAFGLVFGPWLANTYLLVPGLLLHLTATILLLVNVIKPLWADKAVISVGMWHIILSYFWILAPVLMAPVVLFEVGGVPGADIEAFAPQALIYGWMLQFGFAVLPYLFGRTLMPDDNPQLGGTWLSLILVNLGSILLWASIFIAPWRNVLYSSAYLLWVMAMVPIVMQLWRTVRIGLARLEPTGSVAEQAV